MDYGKKRFVPEVGKNAWGNVDYEHALSTAEIADYELFPYPKTDYGADYILSIYTKN